MDYGEVTVTTKSIEEQDDYILIHLTAKSDHVTNDLVVLRYPGWSNANKLPAEGGAALLSIANFALEQLKKKQNNVKSRVLIHCR